MKRGSFAIFVILLFLLTPVNASADLVDWFSGGHFDKLLTGYALSDGQTNDLPVGGDSNTLYDSTLTEEYCTLHFYEDNRCAERYPQLAEGGSGQGGGSSPSENKRRARVAFCPDSSRSEAAKKEMLFSHLKTPPGLYCPPSDFQQSSMDFENPAS